MRIRPDRHTRILVVALAVGMAVHVPILPLWINLLCLVLWGLVLFLDGKSWRVPPRWLQVILAFMAFAVIIATSRGQFDSDSGIGLLCLMAGMKPLEIKGHRDRMITLFLAYFMVVASLFFSDSLEMTAYLFVAVVLITGILIHINHPEMRVKTGFRLASVILMQALPLALIMFVVFPRLQGSLWGLQAPGKGQTGLSGVLTPGSVTELTQNNAVAFRVSFVDKAPSPNRMYWRAMVFNRFDGRRWLLNADTAVLKELPSEGRSVTYEVIVEPHHRKWLFILDYPAVFPEKYVLREDLTLNSGERILAKTRYTFSSSLTKREGGGGTPDGEGLALPEEGNPRAREFARTLRSQYPNPETFVEHLLDEIHEGDFYYTLRPPLSNKDTVDAFWFDARRGYCEHYASAFVFLLRAAGIPSRIVGGYHGGEVNPYGDYVIVRQSFAHVWVEVWIDGKGWVRVDPTASVNESRVDTESLELASRSRPDTLSGESGQGISSLWVKTVLAWDAVNYIWYAKILGYSSEDQSRFLERFGLSLGTLGGVFKVFGMSALLAGVFVLVYFLWKMPGQKQKKDPAWAAYRVFLRKMARTGIAHEEYEGPRAFASRCVEIRKDLARDIQEITGLYIHIRYGGHADEDKVRIFKQKVRRFHPAKYAGKRLLTDREHIEKKPSPS